MNILVGLRTRHVIVQFNINEREKNCFRSNLRKQFYKLCFDQAVDLVICDDSNSILPTINGQQPKLQYSKLRFLN